MWQEIGLALPKLVFAGDAQGRDGYVAELERIIVDEELGDLVRIVGHCSDMPAVLSMSLLVLTPSVEPEAFGRTAAEAGAMSRPVIACDHGGAREIIIEGETGWRVPPRDIKALAHAIGQAVSMSDEARLAMGEKGREQVREHFSTCQLQASTLRVYAEVLNSPS